MSKLEKQYEIWIRQMYNKYKSILFIEKYDFKVEYSKDKEHYLSSKFNYPYLDAKVIWGIDAFTDWKKDKISAERRIVHEFCHIITDPFYTSAVNIRSTGNQIENERERLTDHIAQIVNKHFTKYSK